MFGWSNQRSEKALRSREVSFSRSWSVIVLAALFILLWEQAGTANQLRQAAQIVTQPSIEVALRVRSFVQGVQTWWQFTSNGAEHITRLEEEVQQLYFDRTRVQVLEAENAALREELDQPLRDDRGLAQWYGSDQQWFIDIGCQSGVQPGNLVSYENAFVGIVERAYPSYSEVRTWDDPDWRLAVKVGTASAYGVFSVARSLPEVEEVTGAAANPTLLQDALVVTAGQQYVSPNYVVGKVQEVIAEEGFGTVRLVVDPVIDLRKLQFVRVVKKSEDVCQEQNSLETGAR